MTFWRPMLTMLWLLLILTYVAATLVAEQRETDANNFKNYFQKTSLIGDKIQHKNPVTFYEEMSSMLHKDRSGRLYLKCLNSSSINSEHLVKQKFRRCYPDPGFATLPVCTASLNFVTGQLDTSCGKIRFPEVASNYCDLKYITTPEDKSLTTLYRCQCISTNCNSNLEEDGKHLAKQFSDIRETYIKSMMKTQSSSDHRHKHHQHRRRRHQHSHHRHSLI